MFFKSQILPFYVPTAIAINIQHAETTAASLTNRIESYQKEIQKISSQLHNQNSSLEEMRRKRSAMMEQCDVHQKRIKQLEIQLASFEACKSLPSNM